jgi:prepilin-type N-terminal cleavage/methylation domain-containing protein
MKPKKTNHPHNGGFTLIEVIVTLVIAAIMGTMLVTLMGKNLTGSAVPVNLVGDQYKIVQEMEKITSEYREEIKNGTLTDLATFRTNHVNNKNYVDAATTGLVTLTGTKSGAADITTSPSSILRVTLRSGDQTLQAYFTQ